MITSHYVSRFWEKDSEKNFSLNETRFYFYLISVWIANGSEDMFMCNTTHASADLNMPRMTIVRCRKALKNRGLIAFKEGKNKQNNPYYSFTNVTPNVTVDVTVNVIRPKEKVPPTPPLKENNIKENSSNEELKKAELPSSTPAKQKSERMNWEAFKQTFNEMLSPTIPKVVDMTENRRQRVKAIIKDFGKDSIIQVYQLVQASDFLTGNNKSGWHCDFDWIFKKNNFLKILEGNYNNNRNGTENRRANYASKQEANDYAMQQFLAKRAAKEQGLVIEVEDPF